MRVSNATSNTINLMSIGIIVVDYESIKRELQRRLIYEYRYDEIIILFIMNQ